MKKNYIKFFLLLFLGYYHASSQSIVNYGFQGANNGDLMPQISPTSLLTGNNDDAGTAVAPIGFEFWFMGVRYTHFSANSNGQVRLHSSAGATAIGGGAISDFTSGANVLALVAGDNEVNGGLQYEVLGTAPNRVLVINFGQFYVYWTPDLTNAGNSQVVLYENTGQVQYIYGAIRNASTSSTSRAIFLSSSNTATTAGYVTVGANPTFTPATTAVPNTYAAGSTNVIANLGSTNPGSRWVYSFTPPVPATPSNLTFSAVSSTSMTLNWADNASNEAGYVIYRSTDNITYTYVAQTAANAVSYNATALTTSTLYYWKVYAVSEGALSTEVSASQTTASPATLPVVTISSLTPAAGQCSSVAHTVAATVSTPVGTISSVVINYSFNGVAQTPVSMTLQAGTTTNGTWSGSIPVATPSNAVVAYTVTATNTSSISSTATGTSYSDNPLGSYIAAVTASATSLCAGSSAQLTGSLQPSGLSNTLVPVAVGAGAGTSASYPNPFYSAWSNTHNQYLIPAAELTAAGLSAGNITSLAIELTSTGGLSMGDFSVKMAHTTATNMSSFVSPAFTTVYSVASQPQVVGINTLNFSTPFAWNGTSNVVIEICHGNAGSSATMSSTAVTDATSYVSAIHVHVSSATAAATTCGNVTSNIATYSTRPKFRFTIVSPVTSYSWSNGSTVVGTTPVLSVTPAATTTYTFTTNFANGCSLVSAGSTVTVNAVPTAPSATNSTQCGLGIPGASVASTAGAVGSGQFYWYSAPSAGTLLQSPPYGTTLTSFYNNDFSSSTLTNAALSGNASIGSGLLTLTPNSLSQQGGLTINATGLNSTMYQMDFDMILTSGGADIADGLSYSFADDAVATTTNPSAEHGSGSKLRISFDTYNTANTTNGMGIWVMYNTSELSNYTTTTAGVLAYSSNVSWIPASATTINSHVTATITATGLLTLTVGGNTIFSNLQLPAAFVNANKSTWKHVFSARTGGISGGFQMDNINLKSNGLGTGYTTYQSSIAATTTFYVSEMGVAGGCPSPRTAVTANVSAPDALHVTPNPTSISCIGNSTALTATQTGSNNNYTLTWSAFPAAASGLTAPTSGTLNTPLSVIPTAAGTYGYVISGVAGSCATADTAYVVVTNSVAEYSAAITATPSTICAGNSTTLGFNLTKPVYKELFETFPVTAFGTASVSGTPTATQNTTYFAQGASSVLFNTASTGADVSYSSAANIDLTGVSSAKLSFSHIAVLEGYASSFDYGYVQYSSNGGTTWTSFPTSSYAGTGNLYNSVVSFSTLSYADWAAAFTAGASAVPSNSLWKNETINIPAAALTSQFRVRFRLTTDVSVSYYGWLIDSVAIRGIALPATYSMTWGNSLGSANPLVQAPTTNATYTGSYVVSGCTVFAPATTVTVNPLSTTLAPTASTGFNNQAANSSFTYTDASCGRISDITTATATSLGTTTAAVTVDAAVATYAGKPYLQRHYMITPATNGAATVKLYATQAEFTAFNAAAGTFPLMPTTGSNTDPNIGNVKITLFPGATPVGTGVLYTPTSVFWNGNFWEITVNTPTVGGFFIHTGAIPLDIALLDINGQNAGSRNRINWTTASEANSDRFVLQRSGDATNFTDIATIAANGKASAYTYWDETPISGLNYYRLKMLNVTGKVEYSKLVTLNVTKGSDITVEAFPNPAKDKVNIKVYGTIPANAQIILTDVTGKVISTKAATTDTETLDVAALPSGIYLIKYTSEQYTKLIKLNKN